MSAIAVDKPARFVDIPPLHLGGGYPLPQRPPAAHAGSRLGTPPDVRNSIEMERESADIPAIHTMITTA
jgi:hypothetical protein